MKLTRLLIISVIVIFSHSIGYSQTISLSSVEIMGAQGVFESAFMIRPEGRYKKVKGSPYLDSKWQASQVWLGSDSIPTEFPMRYNIYGNEMQFVHEADTFAIANPLSIRKILLGDHWFEYMDFIHNGNDNLAYFEILVSGPYRLLVLHRVILSAGKEPLTPYHPQNDYDRFVSSRKYYVQTPGSPVPVLMQESRSAWITLSGNNKENFKNYIKSEKIRFHKEEDLIKLVEFLNKISE